MQSLLRFVVPAVVALVIMFGLMALSFWLLEQPAVAAQIERIAERLSVAWVSEPAPEEPTGAVQQAPPAPAPSVDCAAESAYLDGRLNGARACRENLDCVISVPRQRCIVALRVGMAGAIEDELLRVAGACGDRLALPTLEPLCRPPDRGWVPYCDRGVCALHDSFDPSR